jgi:two-component system, chemotaxis family, CheB/CheR fusion protein
MPGKNRSQDQQAPSPLRSPATPDDAAESAAPAFADVQPAASDVAESHPSASVPVVGIGASAGGLAAFEAFFRHMPAETDPGMAFVLVQHLAPDHTSLLAELVQRYTHMRVSEITDGMRVERNSVYIIPPHTDLSIFHGRLQLLEPSAPTGIPLPVDHFFRALAQEKRDEAIGIVLSGAGSDGTLGVRAIQEAGGMVMAQTPTTAEYDSMPQSALATGLVDYTLPPEEMPAQLLTYVQHMISRRTPAVGAPSEQGDDAEKPLSRHLST